MILLLPPPTTKRVMMVVSAYRRGVNKSRIAKNLGVSPQCIDIFIRKYEKYHGKVYHGKHIYMANPVRKMSSITCLHCGIKFHRVDGDGKDSSKVVKVAYIGMRNFCSRKCYGEHERVFSNEEIDIIINKRLCGITWKILMKEHVHSVQVIQKSIWRFLHEKNMLNLKNVSKIWMPSPTIQRIRGRWGWLENSTGLYPK